VDTNAFDVIVIGGGAAGFFAAINLKTKAPNLKVAILERGSQVLTKLKFLAVADVMSPMVSLFPVSFPKIIQEEKKNYWGLFILL